MCSRSRLALVTWVLLTACSGMGGGVKEDSTLDVAASATSVTAGAGTVTLTATVSGDVNVVSWTLAGPGSLAPGQGLTTVYTPPEAVVADTAVTIAAHMNDLTRSAVVTVKPPPPAPVAGRVVFQSGQPVPNATVHIIPSIPPDPLTTTFATTDATGAFTIAGVRGPYEIGVRDQSGTYLLVVQHLRRSDPTLLIDVGGGFEPPRERVAGASGQISGGAGFPQPPSHLTAVAIGTPAPDEWYVRQDAGVAWGSGWVDDLGGYGASVVLTSAAAPGTIQALQWRTDADGWPVEYVASGTRTLPDGLTGGGSRDGQHFALAMTPDATTSISGHLAFNGPSGHLRAIARIGGARLPIVPNPVVPELIARSGAFTLPAPRGAEAVELTIMTPYVPTDILQSYNLGAHRVVAPNAGVDLTILGPPYPVQPAYGDLVDEDTIFTWATFAVPSPLYVVGFDAYGTWWGPLSLKVVTSASSLALGDLAAALSALGVSVPRGAALSWWVFGTSAASTTDEACGPEGYLVWTDDFVWGRSEFSVFHTP